MLKNDLLRSSEPLGSYNLVGASGQVGSYDPLGSF